MPVKFKRLFDSYSRCGVESSFFKLSEKKGIKTFSSKKLRDHCFMTQRSLSRVGLAPKVGKLINWKNPEFFGYITEIAVVAGDIYYEDDPRLEEITNNLILKAECFGYYLRDMHQYNIGLIDGNPVVIDMGCPVKIRKTPRV